jgi:hypothetical protein
MKNSAIAYLLATLFALFATRVAFAQVIDIAGPWILDFPQGKGSVVLQNGGGNPAKYYGLVTLPHPNNPQTGYTFHVTMLSDPSYVKAGNNITFQPVSDPRFQFFMLNVSSSSSGLAWVIPSPSADVPTLKYHGVKAPAHR